MLPLDTSVRGVGAPVDFIIAKRSSFSIDFWYFSGLCSIHFYLFTSHFIRFVNHFYSVSTESVASELNYCFFEKIQNLLHRHWKVVISINSHIKTPYPFSPILLIISNPSMNMSMKLVASTVLFRP